MKPFSKFSFSPILIQILRYSTFSIRYSTFAFLPLLRHSIFNIRYSIFLLLFLISSSLPAQQQWTEPLNISNLGGYSMDPDMVIDHNGVIHVVWSYQNSAFHWLIMYTCSEDDGLTWAEPLDLLQNTDLWMLQPHIACDSKNNLYVTYTHDGNSWTPEGRLIKMLTFDGYQWSEPITVSEGMPGSHYPKVLLDDNDDVYVFWGYLSDEMYYRYRKGYHWSDIYCPYCDSTDRYYFSDGIEVYDNLIHLVGSSMSYNYYGERPQYYEYNLVNNLWAYPEMINNDTIVVDIDLSINKSLVPESAYRKIETNPMYGSDATKHTKKEGNNWSTPDLVSGTDKRQVGQQITIDQNNCVHVVETEYYVSSELETELVHYYKMDNIWMAQPIDSSDNLCNYPILLFSRNRLYVVYWWHSEELDEGYIRFSKNDIITNIKEEPQHQTELTIYPNPGRDNIYIEFYNEKQQHIDLSVFDMTGKHIITLVSETKPPGKCRQLWKVTDKNRKEDAPRLYLIRLISGRNTVTRTVEIIR
jgi:hypothetical protein